MAHKPLSLIGNTLAIGLIFLLAGGSFAQEISPAQEQDFLEGMNALETARKAQAEKYAPGPWGQAKDLLAAAEEARSEKIPSNFPRLPGLPGLTRS